MEVMRRIRWYELDGVARKHELAQMRQPAYGDQLRQRRHGAVANRALGQEKRAEQLQRW